MKEAHPYYEARRDGVVKGFSEGGPVSHQILARYYGKEEASRIWRKTMERFPGIYTDLPYIGGDENALTWNLTSAAFALAFYLTMKEEGKPAEEAGKILYLMMREFILFQSGTDSLSGNAARGIRESRRMTKAFCAMTQRKEYPGNWISAYVEGDPEAFDYGWDTSVCGIMTLFKEYGAGEFVPYLCMLDQIIYPSRGLGLTRTKTLIDGGCCDFRVKAGGKMSLGEPTSARKLREWGFVRE